MKPPALEYSDSILLSYVFIQSFVYQGRPEIIESTTKPQTIGIGSNASCFCDTSGVPQPIISWRFNDSKIPESTHFVVQTRLGRSRLTIVNATTEHSGRYSCEAHNKGGATRVYEPCKVHVVGKKHQLS